MSGKFSIGDGFNVFDEWGNYVGKFEPRGGGIEGLIAIIGLTIFGFGFYFLFKMIKAGFKALFEGRWMTAVVCLAPIWIPLFAVAVIGSSAIHGLVSVGVEHQNQTAALNKIAAHLLEADRATGVLVISTSYGDVTFEKMPGLYAENDLRPCKGSEVDECDIYFRNHRGFWAYKVTIPTEHGSQMGVGGSGFARDPDQLFRDINAGYNNGKHCFLESWDKTVYVLEPEIYQSTNPAMIYCEAVATNDISIDFSLVTFTPEAPNQGFKLELDPYTGLFSQGK